MTAEYSAGSKLEKIFKSGQKAVTGECGPPRGADADHFRHKANYLKDEKLPPEFNDAHASLRGFANSNLHSSLILSAKNQNLFAYAA